MSDTLERIVGTETEFGLIFDGYASISERDLRKALPPGLVMINGFLSNGGRFYLDWNEQLEYASPECRGFTDAVHAEIAGEQIVYKTLEKLERQEKIDGFHLFKRVIDDNGTTWGYHENYLISREAFQRASLAPMMLGHLATRNIFVGAGQWVPREADISRVVPGQKAQGITTDIHSSTTSDKPLLNTRDEPHANGNRWARLHITSGDANISPWATWLKLGTTSLVARLVETQFAHVDEVELYSPLHAGKQVAIDDTLRETYALMNGRHATAANIQEMLISQCETMAERIKIPKEEQIVLAAWRQAHSDIESDPNKLVGRADWVTRRHLLASFVLRHEIDTAEDVTLSSTNQTWDMVHPKAGIGILKFRNKMDFPGYDPRRPDALITVPPEGTRANARGKLIKQMPRKYRGKASVDWEEVKRPDTNHLLNDPYMSTARTHTFQA